MPDGTVGIGSELEKIAKSEKSTKALKIAAGVGAAIGLGLAAKKVVSEVRKISSRITEVDKNAHFFEKDGIKVTSVEFGENVTDKTKAVVGMAGWPWSATEEATHLVQQSLARDFDTRAFNIDAKGAAEDSPQSLAKRADIVRQYLEKQGIEEVTLFGHSKGAINIAYLAENLQRNSKIKVKAVFLANARGLDELSIPDLALRFKRDIFDIGPTEREHTRKTDTKELPVAEIQAGFVRSIVRSIKEFGFAYIPLLKSQFKTLTNIDPIYQRIEAPVWIMVSEQDLISDYRRYVPDKDVVQHLDHLPADSELREGIVDAKKWDQLPEEERQRLSSQENFVTRHLRSLRNRVKMAQISRGRERYLKKNVFTNAEDVRFIRSVRIADHNAIAVRAKQVAHILANIAKKAA